MSDNPIQRDTKALTNQGTSISEQILSVESRLSIIALLALASLISIAYAVFSAEAIIGRASIVDGDSIEIHGTRIRLYGIDALESSQLCTRPDGERWRCGQQASFALADRIGQAVVRCEPRDIDRYRRIVAVCFKGQEDLNRWLVASGWAVAYRRYSSNYVADEDIAREAQANIWSGDFEMPWDWRARRRGQWPR